MTNLGGLRNGKVAAARDESRQDVRFIEMCNNADTRVPDNYASALLISLLKRCKSVRRSWWRSKAPLEVEMHPPGILIENRGTIHRGRPVLRKYMN